MSAVITITRYPWGFECSAVVGPYLERRKYVGYSRRDARALFLEYLAGVNS